MLLTLELFPLIIFACCALYILIVQYFKIKSDSTIAPEDSDVPEKLQAEDVVPEKKLRAVVACSPERKIPQKRLQYDRMTDCRLFKNLYETEPFCEYGCLGYGTCVSYCPRKAILIHNGTAVITDDCDGCGLCLDHCPQSIIKLVPIEKEYFIQCAALGKRAGTQCDLSCKNCGLCSPENQNLSLELANRCPTKRIQKITFSSKKGFKFVHLWFNILPKPKRKR